MRKVITSFEYHGNDNAPFFGLELVKDDERAAYFSICASDREAVMNITALWLSGADFKTIQSFLTTLPQIKPHKLF